MLIQKSLSKINLQNGDQVFLMVDYELNSQLVIKIVNLECQEVYVGNLNDIELRSQAARIRLTFQEFIQKTMKALIESNTDNSNFLYCLEKQDDIYKFHWKSIDEEQTIISLGSVDVRKGIFAIILTDMLEKFSVEMRLMRNKIQELNAELNKTQNQTFDALNQLSIATDMKEKLEKEMYSKFAMVLNEKKRKIRELQQENKHKFHSNTRFQMKKPKKSSKPLVSDSSDDTDIDEPGPSTSKNNISLLFLDDKPILHTNQSQIRNRKVHVSKKENQKSSTTFPNSNQASKSITIEDESDEILFDDL